MLFRFDPASVVQPNDPFLFRHIMIVSADVGKFRAVNPPAEEFPIAPESPCDSASWIGDGSNVWPREGNRQEDQQAPEKDGEVGGVHGRNGE
jgi:hypothetical protein